MRQDRPRKKIISVDKTSADLEQLWKHFFRVWLSFPHSADTAVVKLSPIVSYSLAAQASTRPKQVNIIQFPPHSLPDTGILAIPSKAHLCFSFRKLYCKTQVSFAPTHIIGVLRTICGRALRAIMAGLPAVRLLLFYV
jgi:hypothetical protein